MIRSLARWQRPRQSQLPVETRSLAGWSRDGMQYCMADYPSVSVTSLPPPVN